MQKGQTNILKPFLEGLSILLILVLVVFIILEFFRFEATFVVNASTERVEIKNIYKSAPRIPLHNAYIKNYDGVIIDTCDGSFELDASSVVVIERISKGDISIQITGKEKAGVFFSGEDDMEKNISPKPLKFVEFIIPIESKSLEKENFIIPFAGVIEIGRNPYFETYYSPTSLTKSGEIKILSESILPINTRYFESGEYKLNMGDQFTVELGKKDSVSRAYGFIAIDERSGMNTVYRVNGHRGIIITPGPKNKEKYKYEITASLLDKFSNDPAYKSVVWTLSIVFFLNAFITLIIRLRDENFKNLLINKLLFKTNKKPKINKKLTLIDRKKSNKFNIQQSSRSL